MIFFKNNVKFEFPMVILVGIDTPYAKIKKFKNSKIQKGVTKIPKNYFFSKNNVKFEFPMLILVEIDTPCGKKNFSKFFV